MIEGKKSRRVFSPEEKLAVLHMRPLVDPAMPVTVLCKRVGITPKTYYEWEKAYQDAGLEGLKPVIRTPYSAAITNPEVIQGVRKLAQEHPLWPCTRLHREIQKRGVKISRYGFERLLTNEGLLTVESRVAIVEQAIVKGDISPGSYELASLFKVNPCLEDWYRMGERPRYPMGILAIALGRKNPVLRGRYLVITVDFDSLYLCGLLAKARDYTAISRFVSNSNLKFGRQRGSDEVLYIFRNIPESIIPDGDLCDILRKHEINKYLANNCLGWSGGTLRVITQKVKEEFLPQLKEATSSQAGEMLLNASA